MKKLFKFLLVLNIIFSSWTISAVAAHAETVEGSFEGKNYAVAGEDITLTYYLNASDVEGLSGKLSYDADVMTLTGYQWYLDSEKWSTNEITTDNGSIVAYDLVMEDSALNGRVAVFSVTFTMKDDAELGSSTIVKMTKGKYSDSEYASHPIDESEAVIQVAEYVAQIGETKYISLESAVAAAVNNDKIVIIADIEYGVNNAVSIPRGLTVTLDLNGHTISQIAPEASSSYLIQVNGTLTIIDDAGNGKITAKASIPDASYGYGNYTLENNGTLTISSGTVEHTSTGAGAYYAINNYAGATLNVEGGLVTSNSYTVRQASFGTAENTVNISGGEIVGYIPVQVYDCTQDMHAHLNITGGTFTPTDTTTNISVYAYATADIDTSNIYVNISGGIFNGDVAFNALYSDTNIDVSGGVYHGRWGVYSYSDEEMHYISNGIFKTRYSEQYLYEGLCFGEITSGEYEGYYTVFESKVRYDYTWEEETYSEYFPNLAEAVNSVYTDTTDNVITVLESHSYTGNAGAVIPVGVEVTIDLNGKTVTQVLNENAVSQMIDNYGTLIIKDTGNEGKLINNTNNTLTGEWPEANYATNIIKNSGSLTVESGIIQNTGTSSICYAIDNNSTSYDAYVVINGGELISTGNSGIRLYANSTTKENTVTIKNGYIEAKYYAISFTTPGNNKNKGSLIIKGGEFEATDDEWNISVACFGGSENFSVVIEGGAFNDNIHIDDSVNAEITGGVYVYDRYLDTDDNSLHMLETHVKEGYIVADYEDAKYNFIVREGKFVAQVEDDRFETFQEAVEEAGGTKTIILLDNIDEEYQLAVGETLIIKKGDYTITVTAPEGYDLVEVVENGVTTYTLEAIAYTITYVDAPENSNPTSYTVEDADITLADPVKTGYTFAGWYDEEDNKVEVIVTSLMKNRTITAHWYPDCITSDVFSVDQDNLYICKVNEQTSAAAALNVINEKEYTVIKHEGVAMNLENPDEEHPYVGTGDTAVLMHGDVEFKTYQFVVTGDINGDGVIDVADLVMIRAYILGNYDITGIYFMAADVNNDGDVDIADLVMIQAHIIGKTTIVGH